MYIDNKMENGHKLLFGICIAMLLCFIPSVLACKPTYTPGQNVTIEDVIVKQFEGAPCNITIFQNNTEIMNGTMNMSGLAYQFNAGNLSVGSYVSEIICIQGGAYAYGSCDFQVKGDGKMEIALIILMICITVFFFWMFSTQKEDNPFKALYFFFGLIFTLSTLWIGRLLAASYSIGADILTIVDMIFYILCVVFILLMTLYFLKVLTDWLKKLQEQKKNKAEGNSDD